MAEEKIIAFCGICCSDCPAYRATINDDDTMRKQIAEKWTSDNFPITERDVNCHGCPVTDRKMMAFVGACKVRACALDKGVEDCAHCDDYGCAILRKVWEQTGDDGAKKTLDTIREKLK